MALEKIKFSDDVEISFSDNELTIKEKAAGISTRILMFAVLVVSVIMLAVAWGLAIFLLCCEISLLAVSFAIMLILLSIAPLNGIFFSSSMLFQFSVKIILEEKSFKYSVKNGLLRYSKNFDRDQSIVTAPVSSRGDWGYCACISTKSLLKYVLPTVPIFPILTPRLVGSKKRAGKEAKELSDILSRFGIKTQLRLF